VYNKLIIAIDGHSSCGKSTVAKSLAEILKYTYIDSGAMYRAVTLFCMRKEIIKDGEVDEERLLKYLSAINIHFSYNKEKKQYLTWLNDELVEDEIREMAVSNNVSLISKIEIVRNKLVKIQQQMGKKGGIVMDGRDIGSVVFPNADIKIFMTASVEVRAKRRYDELVNKGNTVLLEDIKQNIEKRDYLDQNRDIAPLVQAEDAILLDNSLLTREEQLNKILDIIDAKQKELNNKKA
jgi:cytidylate kinase